MKKVLAIFGGHIKRGHKNNKKVELGFELMSKHFLLTTVLILADVQMDG
jgi:hypothetical protein